MPFENASRRPKTLALECRCIRQISGSAQETNLSAIPSNYSELLRGYRLHSPSLMFISFCKCGTTRAHTGPPCPKSRTKRPFQRAKCASRSATRNHPGAHRPSAEAGDQLSNARTGDHAQRTRSTSGLKIQVNSVFGALLALNTESLDTAAIYHRIGASSFRNW